MKNILCDKDGKFLSVNEKNETFAELGDGDCPAHGDGCISICREYECKENISEISCHVYLRNNKLHFPQTGMSFPCHDFVPIRSKRIGKIRWRAKKGCMYYCTDSNGPGSFCAASRAETFGYMDECRLDARNHFRTGKEAGKKPDSIKDIPNDQEGMLHPGRTDCRIPGNGIAEGPPGEICCHSPCSPVSGPVYIDGGENLNVLQH